MNIKAILKLARRALPVIIANAPTVIAAVKEVGRAVRKPPAAR